MKDANLDLDQHAPQTPGIPVGAIPGGSGCSVALYTCGSLDIETCALMCVLGRTCSYDATEVRVDNKSVVFANLFVGSGCISNASVYLECIKWMGIHRYKFFVPAMWWKWRMFEVVIDYLPVPEHDRLFRLDATADGPLPPCITRSITDGPEAGWKTLRYKIPEVGAINFGTRDCIADIYRKKLTNHDLATGRMVLVIFHKATMYETGPAFEIMKTQHRAMIHRRYMEQIEVTELRVRGIDEWRDPSLGLLVGVDGEGVKITKPEYSIKSHKGLLKFFSYDRNLVNQSET